VAPSLWSFDGASSKWLQSADDNATLSVDGVALPAPGAEAGGNGGAQVRTKTGKKGKGKPRAWDEARDAWTPERFAAMLAADGRSKRLKLQVRSAGWWNVDSPYNGSLLTLRVLTPEGEPVVSAMIYAVGVDYRGSTVGKTNSDGSVSLIAQFGSVVELDVQLAAAAGTEGLGAATDDWDHPTPPALPSLTLGKYETGAIGATVSLGDLMIGGSAAAAA